MYLAVATLLRVMRVELPGACKRSPVLSQPPATVLGVKVNQ